MEEGHFRKVLLIADNAKPSKEIILGAYDKTTGLIRAIDSDGNPVFYDGGGGLVPTGKYLVKISQAAFDAPTVNIIKNSIGAISFSRIGFGNYGINLNGAFPDQNKIAITISQTDNRAVATVHWQNANQMRIETGVGGLFNDDRLNNATLEINIYP